MRVLLTFALAFTVCLALRSQSPKGKGDNITKEEITMTSCPLDPSADAAILDNYGDFYFDRYYYSSAQELRTFYQYKVRLKVFNDAGKKYATVTIPYHGWDSYEDVIEISGVTYNLDEKGEIIKTKLKSKNINWQRNSNKTWNCSFTMPDVKPGSVVEYSYKIASLDFVKLRDWMFQKDIPVLNSYTSLTTPNFFQYAFFSNIPAGLLNVSRNDLSFNLPFYNTSIYISGSKLQLIAHNIPAFRKEPLMPDSSTQILKGQFLLAAALTKPPEFSGIRDYYLMPYLKPLLLTTTGDYYETTGRMMVYNDILSGFKIIEGMEWDSFAKKLSKDSNFGKTMLKAFECKWVFDSVRRIEDPEKRMIATYNLVKDYMHWNGEYRIFASQSLEKTFEMKTGSSADINMVLINLLNRMAIQAKPVLISTRSYGPVYKERAFSRKFNHVIVSVEMGDQRFLLDATDPNRPYNLLSQEDLNGEGLLLSNLDYKWVPLRNSIVSSIATRETIIIESDHTEKVLSIHETGYPSLSKLNGREDSALVKTFADQGFTVKNFNASPAEPGSYVTELSLAKKNDQEQEIKIALYPSLNVYSNLFTSEERYHPIDFGYEQVISAETEVTIPEGYQIGILPQNEVFEVGDKLLSYSRTLEVKNNKILIKRYLDINQPYLPSALYQDLKLFFRMVNEKENELIVLVRK